MNDTTTTFEWDTYKSASNLDKHGIDFQTAQKAFLDPDLLLFEDLTHSSVEKRYFCIGKVEGKIISVRFTYRGGTIRIIGAGKWRKGRKLYEKR